MSEALTPARIMEVGMAFWPAKTLLSAVELGLFTTLGANAMTGAELERALGLHRRANPDFFDTLLALRFLDRDSDGADARYRNSAETARFLDRCSPDYMGGFLEMANARLYPFWGDLTEALRTGKPQNETKHARAGMFEELYSKPERLEQFMEAMAGISAGNFQAFAQRFDCSRYKTLCDVGGANGLLSMLVARAHPHMRCISADLPAATAIAARKIKAAGLDDRVSAQPLDFFNSAAARRRDHDGDDPSRLEPREEGAPREGASGRSSWMDRRSRQQGSRIAKSSGRTSHGTDLAPTPRCVLARKCARRSSSFRQRTKKEGGALMNVGATNLFAQESDSQPDLRRPSVPTPQYQHRRHLILPRDTRLYSGHSRCWRHA